MQSIQLIVDQRDPGQIQVYATGIDASVASLGGLSQATLWLPLDLARKLRRDLLERLGDTPAVQRVQPNPAFTREPTCRPWCAGATEPHGPGECYAETSFVTLTLEPHLAGESGVEPPAIDIDLEVHDGMTVVGIAVGDDTTGHRILTAGEARQLAASLVDPADLAAADTAAGGGS
jgi:hypothetical protein